MFKIFQRYINRVHLPSSVKERLNYLFKIKKKYFYEELVSWFQDIVGSLKEFDELLMKNTRIIYEKLSKTNYPFFSKTFSSYKNNIVEDKNSKGQFYDVKFYISKY